MQTVGKLLCMILTAGLFYSLGCETSSSEDSETLVKNEAQDNLDLVISRMALIPAGSFEMGDHHDNMNDALPVHRVELKSFYMDVTEVTVGDFKKFILPCLDLIFLKALI